MPIIIPPALNNGFQLWAPTSDGVAGSVFQTDGNGNGSFTASPLGTAAFTSSTDYDASGLAAAAFAAAVSQSLQKSANLSDLVSASTARTNIGLGNLTNDTQTKAAILPNTAPNAGQFPVGNAGGTAYAPVSMSGDGTISNTGLFTLSSVNSNTGAFGDASNIPAITVNAKGLVTAVTTNAVVAPAGTLSGTVLKSTVVTSSLVAVGTIGTGVWQGSVVQPTYGGTGVNNGSNTLTLHGNNTVSLWVNDGSGSSGNPSVFGMTGSPYTAGTTTTNVPLFYFNNSANAPSSWSSAGTYLGFNTSNGFAGNVIDLHNNGGGSVFRLTSAGVVACTGWSSSSTNTVSYSPTASNYALGITGTLFTGGTTTTTLPALLFQPSGTSPVSSWLSAGTFLGWNAASGFTGNFADAHVNGGSSVFNVDYTGTINAGIWNGSVISSSKGGAGSVSGILFANGSGVVAAVTVGTGLSFSTGTLSATGGGGGTPGGTNGQIQYNNSGAFGGLTIGTGLANSAGSLVTSAIPNASLTNSAITIAGTSTSLGGSIALDTITGLSSTGILKRTGANTLAIASSGTDYAPATSGSSLLYGNGSGGFSNVTVDSSLTFSAGTLSRTGITKTLLTFVVVNPSGITTGVQTLQLQVPKASTITGWVLTLDAGTATVDIYKQAYSTSATPSSTIINTGSGGVRPAVASGITNQSSSMTGWTTSVSANDQFVINITAVATAKSLCLQLIGTN